MYRKIFKLLKPYLHFVVLSLVFSAITVVLTLYAPILVGDGIDYILGPENVTFEKIGKILVQLAAITVITSLAQWLMNLCNNTITYHVVKDVREDAFAHLQKLPLKYVDSHASGEIISRIITDVEQFSDGLLLGFTQLFSGVTTVLVTLGFMLSINIKISLIVILLTPVSFLIAGFIAKNTYSMFKKQSETRADLTALVDEMVGNQKVVKAFGYEEKALERFVKINRDLKECSTRAIFFSSLTNPSTRFVNGLVYSGVGIYGAVSAMSGIISVGQLSCFLTYANQYAKPINEISSVVTELQNALACIKRVYAFLEEDVEVEDKDGAQILENPDGSIVLKEVSFAYQKEKPLLNGLNLEVKPGQ